MRDPLDLPVRRRIYLFIRSNPGVHFRELQRALDLSVGQLDFHINEMVKRELITKEATQGNARYFIADTFKPIERKAMSFLRKDVSRSLILFLRDHPGSTPGSILENFDMTGPNLSYHLNQMVKKGLLMSEQQGRTKKYYLADTEMINDLLVAYRTTLMDKLIEIFI